MNFTIKSNLIDLIARETFPAEVTIDSNRIVSIKRVDEKLNTYILPGFVDAHVHVESSMLVEA